MPRSMKVYTTNNGARIPEGVRDAIGAASHVGQMAVVVIAPTKKAALELMNAVGVYPYDDVRLNDGYPLGASILEHADGHPGVYGMRLTPTNGAPVVIVHHRSVTPVGVVGEITVDGRRQQALIV